MRLTTNYVMKQGDDARRIHIILKEEGKVLDQQPDSAKLKIAGFTALDLVAANDPQAGPGWEYHFTDADFTAFGSGTFQAEVITLTDDEQKTYPTKGYLTITVIPLLA